jgi:hypothetical protein
MMWEGFILPDYVILGLRIVENGIRARLPSEIKIATNSVLSRR